MAEKLNPYENLFFHLFSSTSRTNKSIPEWSTTIFLSVATTLYIVALGILSPLDMKALGRESFMLSMLIGIGIHWFYFLRHDRIIKKLRRIKPKPTRTGHIITGLYTFGGFAILFYAVGMRDWTYYAILIAVFGLVELSTYLLGSEPEKFE